ncbi:hypothetical protein [Paracoccus beibuensis]|uniref:hypothetical protein n=1 Tax=Paracoccus beibuensis TaxID=547602 RepID=UPI00223F9542|nr:hypothetical protein [Paracoccus beibuensis]
MAKAVTVIGWVLLAAGGGAVLLGLAGIAITEGVGAVVRTVNPFNIAGFVAIVATLAPGLLMLMWGERIAERRRDQNPSR